MNDQVMSKILQWMEQGKSKDEIAALLKEAGGLAGGTGGVEAFMKGPGGRLAGGLGIAFLASQLLGDVGNVWLGYRQQEMQKQAMKNQSLANAQMVNADAAAKAAERRDAHEREANMLALTQQQMRMGDTAQFRQLLAGLGGGDPTGGMAQFTPDARGSRVIADADAARILAAQRQQPDFFSSIGLT